MKRHPFADPRCMCPDAVDLMRAELSGTDVALCELHQQTEIRARDATKKRDDAQRTLAREQVILEELRSPPAEPPPSCSCDFRADLGAALMGEQVAPCVIHRPAPAATGPSIGLNDPQLAAMTGFPAAPSEHDQPLDAA